MDYVLIAFFSALAGAACIYVLFITERLKFNQDKQLHEAQLEQHQKTVLAVNARYTEIQQQTAALRRAQEEFDARVVSYTEIQAENAILKTDLKNLELEVRRIRLDRDQQGTHQDELDRRVQEIGERYLKENVKWIGSSLTANNFGTCKQRLLDVIGRCRSIGFEIPARHEADLVQNLRDDFEKVVRAAFEREEQARIKAQIREEQQREREIERELKQLEREREAIATALAEALARAKDEHSEEIERLRARLADAEAKKERAISQAQQTKSGFVYVISNIGSFGDGVFKVGMTRRLEPLDRVRELSDASVPFSFDVHMLISADDAPKLENALHRSLHTDRVNKINPRKEFFRTTIDNIRTIVKEHHGEVEYVADPEALEYRQSLELSVDDQEFIEHVYEEIDDDDGVMSTEL